MPPCSFKPMMSLSLVFKELSLEVAITSIGFMSSISISTYQITLLLILQLQYRLNSTCGSIKLLTTNCPISIQITLTHQLFTWMLWRIKIFHQWLHSTTILTQLPLDLKTIFTIEEILTISPLSWFRNILTISWTFIMLQ